MKTIFRILLLPVFIPGLFIVWIFFDVDIDFFAILADWIKGA